MIGCEIFVFILVLFVVVILYCIYLIVNPSLDFKRYNFVPFPAIKPPDVPIESYNIVQSSSEVDCLRSIQTCNSDSDCSKCGNYECITVKKGESVIVDGKQLDEGKWCVPKGKNDKGCGTYTGRAIWSESQGRQGWSCVCLYPELFGGDDCLTQYACKDVTLLNENQSENKLVKRDDRSKVWDPSQPDFYPPDGKSPYAKDADGNPVFVCSCDSTKAGKKYVSLPNDLYRCHADPCTEEHTSSFWSSGQKSCVCDPSFAKSNTDGVCRSMKEYCNPGSWNPDTNQCDCPSTTGSVRSNCSSDYFFREGEKECENKNNPGGSICFAPCDATNNPCQHDAKCIVTADGSMCDCTSASPLPSPLEWSGNYCEKQCLKPETVIQVCSSSITGTNCQNPKYDSKLCCNGTYEKTINPSGGISDYEIRCR